MRSRALTWISGLIVLVLVIVRENTPSSSTGVVGLVGYIIGAGVLAYIFSLIARAVLKSRVEGDPYDLYWNIGIIAYGAFTVLMWLALGR